MDKRELTFIGRISRTHGYEGDVVIPLEPGISGREKKMEPIFVVIDGLPVPFFISRSSVSKGILMVQLAGYESKEKVASFVGNDVFIRKLERADHLKGNLSTESLVGYTVKSPGAKVGTIVNIVSYPMQLMLEVETENGTTILVPFNEELLIKLDKVRKTVVLDLPEGLTDINS